MPAYDATLFAPPAPLAQVTLRHPKSGDTLPGVPMLLDSGADVTLVPQASVNQLGLVGAADEIYELVGFDGATSFAAVVRLEMVFLNRTFRGRFLLIDREWGVLGRDILNLVSLLLDGPSLTWLEQHRRR
jgi:hypothetical protein